MAGDFRRRTTIFALLLGVWTTTEATSDYGTSGLIKVPDARMYDDGALTATIAADEVANMFNITFQALPRVQGTFRYTVFNPNEIKGSRDKLRDRSYAIKALLWRESDVLPAIAVGARDILGTGNLEAEFVVASKEVGPIDASLGIGWGRLGSRGGFDNPLNVLSERFEERPSRRDTGGDLGGKSRANSFFRGDAAIFGGFKYSLADLPLSLTAEYETDDYSREVNLGTLKAPSPWNFGLSWAPANSLALRVSWLRGDTLGFSVSASLDTKSVPPRKYQSGNISAVPQTVAPVISGGRSKNWYDRMLPAAEQTGLYLREAKLDPDSTSASLLVENRDYALTADALNQILMLSENYLPSRVEEVEVLIEENGLIGPTVTYRLQRQREMTAFGRPDEIQVFEPRKISNATNLTDYGYPVLALGADFAGKVQLMDPDDPARKGFYAKLTARVKLSDHSNIWFRYDQNIYNDFSTSRRAISKLPKVRTEINRYLVDGSSGIEQFFYEYRNSLGPELHARAYIGIIEGMYGGGGAEFLFAPYDSRWAIGANLNAVKQRAFDRTFKFRDYETVTGHLSAFYAAPIFNIDLGLHVGRYLAKDRGYTLEARRTFDSGFSVGAFFTRTNVSAEDFGEGSFDKGLFFNIPFNGFLATNTRSSYSTVIRSLERDGGRRLDGGIGSLWFERRAIRYDAIEKWKSRIVPR